MPERKESCQLKGLLVEGKWLIMQANEEIKVYPNCFGGVFKLDSESSESK